MSEIRSQATPARDELAELLRDAELPNTYYHQDDGQGTPAIRPATPDEAAEMALDVMEAAGWSKPRTVNDVDQLEALPAGTVLRNNKSGRVFEKARDKGAGKSKWMRMQDRWVYETYEILNESTWTVLFTPGEAE
ncbi:hypothetical protein SEA_WHACK_62 [Rhodococcus phage Whack]|uniref:Uncharacterized protein n=1 Tax=Rhodococcus phage Whack TaxID=2591132 RepID=A0A515MKC3_9CAUD|nr:hypothetical protein HWC40_gp62 [Rhodococcus phage Whack]QDM57125.1 hypothetical protein SEA_WHACK_62 [Rhodococcus phage Whack]